jgi:hypothetical protein
VLVAQELKQRFGGIAVGNARGGDQAGQEQAEGVDGDVAFAAVDVLPGVVAAVTCGDGLGGGNGLGVDDRCGRFRGTTFALADTVTEPVVVLGQGAALGGALEVGVDGRAGREVGRELAPLAAAVGGLRRSNAP